MRVFVSAFLMVCILIGASVPVQAQFLNRLKKKAQDAVQDRVEEKIDQKLRQVAYKSVDRTWENIFGESTEDLEEGAAPPSLPYSLSSNANTEEEYKFVRESRMEIINYEDGDEETILMKMYQSENGDYSGTTFEGVGLEEGEEPTMIYDYKNNAMVMLMTSEEGKFSFAYEWTPSEYMVSDESGEKVNPYSDFESLGTKTILGYDCEGYRSETDQTVTEYWITKEEVEGLSRTLDANSNTKFLMGSPMMIQGYGTLLEVTSTEKGSDNKMVMKMLQVNKKVRKNYTMSDYPVIGSE